MQSSLQAPMNSSKNLSVISQTFPSLLKKLRHAKTAFVWLVVTQVLFVGCKSRPPVDATVYTLDTYWYKFEGRNWDGSIEEILNIEQGDDFVCMKEQDFNQLLNQCAWRKFKKK